MNLTFAKLAVGLCACGITLAAAPQAVLADRPARQAQAKPPAAAPPTPEVKRTVYGDIVISGWQQTKFQPDLGSVQFTGPNTVIEVPDKQSGSRLVLHSDDIKLIEPRKSDKTRLELRGHVRYTVTQPTPMGERKLTGTAGAGDYRRSSQKVVLSQGVRAELIDPSLDGPGSLRAGAVTVDISATPYTYTLSGDSDTNDIRFTPRPRPVKKGPDGKVPPPQNPANQIGPVHISRWESGTFQTGKVAKFEGTQVVADLKSRTGTPQGQLKARHIESEFNPAGEIARAQAIDDVHYQFDRPISRQPAAPRGKIETGRQEVTGTSREAIYEPDAGKVTLDGDIDATLVNTLTLAEPAKLLASRLVMTEPDPGKADSTLRFEVTGAPNRRRLTFTPRPAEPRRAPAPAAPPAVAPPGEGSAPPNVPGPPPFALGSLVLKGFEKITLEPGKSLDVISDGKQMLLVDTADAKTKSASHLETHHFIATLAKSGEITSAETGGPVTFHIQQPGAARVVKKAGSAPAPAKAVEPQSLNGNAAKAVFKSDGKAQTLALQGPLNAQLIDAEHLVGPGSVKGGKDDTFSVDLITREFTFDTPHETMVIEFTPRPIEQEPDKAAPKPTDGKRKK